MDSVRHIIESLLKAFGREKVTPHPTLKFHKKRGKNILMGEQNAVASRVCDYRFGMVFSQRPVRVGEFICVQVLKKNSNWQGDLRVGFTHINPIHFDSEELEGSNVLQSTAWPACCWFSSVWETDYEFVTFCIKPNGNIVIKIDDKEERIIYSNVHPLSPSETLWAAVDVYGEISTVQFVYHPTLMKASSSSSSPSPSPIASENEILPFPQTRTTRPNIFTFDFTDQMGEQCSPGDICNASLQSPIVSPSQFMTADWVNRRPCVICMDNDADSAFIDCGHLCCCYECATKHWRLEMAEGSYCKCPVCRRAVQKFLRIY